MFENKKTKKHGVHYSRYIASYMKEAARFNRPLYRDELYDWLIAIDVDEHEAMDIVEIATCGKMELETSAYLYLKKLTDNERNES